MGTLFVNLCMKLLNLFAHLGNQVDMLDKYLQNVKKKKANTQIDSITLKHA